MITNRQMLEFARKQEVERGKIESDPRLALYRRINALNGVIQEYIVQRSLLEAQLAIENEKYRNASQLKLNV